MRKHIGWIALDIDGTITDATHHAPQEVIDFLHALEKKGWTIVFITGRTLSFAQRVVKEFDFPHYLAIQNGADILFMPDKQLVVRHYLDEKVLPLLEEAYRGEAEDFILYTGYDRGDFCYFRPSHFSPHFTEHLHKIMALSPEPWQPLSSYAFDKELRFPLAKCLGTKAAMQRINDRLQSFPELSATLIRDPLGQDVYLNLVTAPLATKGNALRTIRDALGDGGPTIAAGDDLNDISMLEAADVKVVMDSAPPEMLSMADVIGTHGDSHGIIAALEQAISLAGGVRP